LALFREHQIRSQLVGCAREVPQAAAQHRREVTAVPPVDQMVLGFVKGCTCVFEVPREVAWSISTESLGNISRR
jgi:hypothetical protein